MGSRTLRKQRAALEQEWARAVPPASTQAARRVPEVIVQKPSNSGRIRGEVAQSWLRSLRTVDPGRNSAPDVDADEARRRWTESPLRGPVTDLSDKLHSIAHDADYVAAVTDENGTILWSYGGRTMRRKAESVNFAPGGRWDEENMGTNALSLALRTGRPSSVFSAEHLVAALHGWVCYCAPIRSPAGRQLGVLDLSTTWDRAHPLAMSTTRALVSAIEARLRSEAPLGTGVRLTCLGRPQLVRDGHVIALRPRLLEILALLALEPEGLSAERLRFAIYGDRPIAASTIKADVSHLRSATGSGITSRVYQLTTPLSCDAVELRAALEAGDTTTAIQLYQGPLFPDSDTPGIVDWRAYLAVGVRNAVLASRDVEHALRYSRIAVDDLEAHEHALGLLPAHDTRRGAVLARIHAAKLT